MNLPDHKVILVNKTQRPLSRVRVLAKLTGLDGRVIAVRDTILAGKAEAIGEAFTLDLAPLMAHGPVLVRPEALDAGGKRLADNFYWQAATDDDYRLLAALAPAKLAASAFASM